MLDLESRIDLLESLDDIRQLAAKFALALDMRNLDALVGLYVENVRVSPGVEGRLALRTLLDGELRKFTGTSHQIGNHIIEFDNPDLARGIVYCRCEHESGDRFVVLQKIYDDIYERVGGEWYFRRRLHLRWYAADMLERPLGPDKIRWPGEPPRPGHFQEAFPSWDEYWAVPRLLDDSVQPRFEKSAFLKGMRASTPRPPQGRQEKSA